MLALAYTDAFLTQLEPSGQLGGIAFGLAIAGAVFINEALSELSILLPDVARSELQLAISGTSGAYFQSLDATTRNEAINIIVSAIQKVFIPVYVGAAFSLILSVCFTVSLNTNTSSKCW